MKRLVLNYVPLLRSGGGGKQLRSLAQRNFNRGLSSTEGLFEQPPRTLPRLSNFLLTKRGALTTCDGSLFISRLNGATSTTDGPWTEISLFQPVNVNRYYIGIKKDLGTHLSAPAVLAVVDGGAGGVLAAATYRYEVTALDGAGGETTVSNEAAFANPGAHKANASWGAVTNATGYNVYRTAAGGAAGTEVFLTSVTTNSFVDDGSITPGTSVPPTANTTQSCLFFKIPATSYGAGNILATSQRTSSSRWMALPGVTAEAGEVELEAPPAPRRTQPEASRATSPPSRRSYSS